jgi:hypothetical protein
MIRCVWIRSARSGWIGVSPAAISRSAPARCNAFASRFRIFLAESHSAFALRLLVCADDDVADSFSRCEMFPVCGVKGILHTARITDGEELERRFAPGPATTLLANFPLLEHRNADDQDRAA